MFSQTLSLNNTRDIIANNISLIIGNDVTNILDLFQVGNDNDMFYSKTYIDNLISNYSTSNQINTLLNDKLDIATASNLYYNKSWINNLIIEYSTTLQMNTLLALKVNTTTYNTGLSLKQNIINSNDLDVSDTNGLQGFLDVHSAGIASLNTSFNNLGNSYYTKPFVDAMVALKQNIITDGSLTIAKTNGLQNIITLIQNDNIGQANTITGLTTSVINNTNAIALKQDIIIDGSLTIAKTSGLQTALTLIQNDNITQSNNISAIVSTLTLKSDILTSSYINQTIDGANAQVVQLLVGDDQIQPLVEGIGINLTQGVTMTSPLTNQRCIISVENCPISSITNLQNTLTLIQQDNTGQGNTINSIIATLNTKQDTITDNSLTIARTSGLQTALDYSLEHNYGPSVGFAKYLIVGGTGGPSGVSTTTSRIWSSMNLHCDSTTGGNSIYFQHYGGTGGVRFSNGIQAVVASINNVGAYSQASDDNVKFFEEVILDGLSVINKLSPQRYIKTFKPTDNPETDGWLECGLIAQQVEQIPELVHAVTLPKDADDLYSLNYGQILPFLISAVKELSNRIVILEQRQ